MTTDYR